MLTSYMNFTLRSNQKETLKSKLTQKLRRVNKGKA